jgi:sodium transport system permease protein
LRDRFGVVESVLLLVGTVGLLFTGGGLLQQRFGFPGLFASEVLVVLAPTLIAWRLLKLPPSALGLARPNARSLLGGALVGAGGFYLVSAGIEAFMEKAVPLPPELKTELQRLMFPPGGMRPLVIDLAVLAVTPAICEEILFRGALMNAWQARGKVIAIAATSIAFGLFHGWVYKFLPTTVLALLFGTVAWRARSIVPSMVAHFTNNALVVLLVRYGYEDPPAIGSKPGIFLACGSVVAIASGIALTGGRRES